MAQMTMYGAVNNSPKTTVSVNMTASDTTIQVERVDVLPAPPNLATLGEDENAEVISYSGKDANTLTGVVRGIKGTTASPWPVGTAVYRAYTAYDHDAFKANIEDLENRKANSVNGKNPDEEGNIQLDANAITETEERVFVTPREREKVESLAGKNLLVNWYLADPVNQRGQTLYTDTVGDGALCIDHWWITNLTSASLQDGYLYLQYPGSGAGTYICLQKIENFAALRGKTLTFSMLFGNLTGSAYLQAQFRSDYVGNVSSSSISSKGLVSLTFTVPEDAQQLWVCLVASEKVSFTARLVAAKLELGEVQTLAKKEGEVWTLLDPPPDPVLELARCQRYYYKLENQASITNLGISTGMYGIEQLIYFPYSLPVSMRIKPTLTHSNTNMDVLNNYTSDNHDKTVSLSTLYLFSESPDHKYITMRVKSSNTNIPRGTVAMVQFAQNVVGWIAFDAEMY